MILKNRNIDFDPNEFALTLQQINGSKDDPAEGVVTRYSAELKWVEPFVTQKSQTLNLEIQSWQHGDPTRNYLFVGVSPRETTAEIWKEMRPIRDSFYESNRDHE